MMNKKVVITALVVLVLSGLYLTRLLDKNDGTSSVAEQDVSARTSEVRTPPVRSDWTTYKNDSIGYAISYPSTWYLDVVSDHLVRIASTPTSTNMHGTGWPSGIWVDIFDSSSTDPRSEAICQDTGGKYLSEQFAPDMKAVCYGEPMGGIEVSSNIYPKDSQNQGYIDLLDQIVETFSTSTAP